MLFAVGDSGRRLTADEVDSRRLLGAAAAEQNIALRNLIDLYLSATWLTWRELPSVQGASGTRVRERAESVLRAADDAIVALTDGYDAAQRVVLREEAARRREFIDDLLTGRSDLGRLAEMAERFGLRLVGQLAVAAVRSAVTFADGDSVTRLVESTLLKEFGARDVLVTTKDGLLICIASAAALEAIPMFGERVEAALNNAHWRMGVGRPHPGPGGVIRSYEEARGTIELADSLGLAASVVNTADLLVFQVLLRDRVAIIDLVDTVLSPLIQTRGGAKPLLATLEAYFASGGVTAAAARRLYLSVRAVTYRLSRIRELTGRDVTNPTDRFTLEVAVLGARLLDWPDVALPATE
ncbi:MAG: helix-turn-helix domain-containing protein [Mycobacteriaceae bacterium]|nr:helix-turn-helix domain-containing protein [Mycobacteriaceae bacterium]